MRYAMAYSKRAVPMAAVSGTFGYWLRHPWRASCELPMTADRPVSTVVYAEDLVRRIRANDARAFDELYARYWPRVMGYLVQRLSGSVEEAEDLAADVFTRVYQKIDTFEPRGAPLSAWVIRIAHNQLIDSLRRRSKLTQVTLDDAPEIASGPVFTDIDQGVAIDQIKAGLEYLTPEQRQVIVLRFLEGMSLAETATAVGRNVDAVKKLQARGLASLRRRIDCLSGCWRIDFEHTG
jgi:RNA polymerase sigma-70 factor, ECF subfamily